MSTAGNSEQLEEQTAATAEEHGPREEPSASGISFTFHRKAARKKAKGKDGEGEGERDFVVSLEGRELQSVKPKPEKKEYIVPLIKKNVWRLPPGSKRGTGKEEEQAGKSEEDKALEKEAAEAIMRDLKEAQLRGSQPQDEGTVVPLIMQNKPPTLEGREDDDLADVELRPEQSTLDDYEAMPIEIFGEAVLRGMGWKKGEAIGKTNKGLAEPIEFIPRLGGLGLGAAPRPQEKPERRRIRKPGEEERKPRGPYVDKDGRVKHVKRVGEEIPEQCPEGFAVGKSARVLKGPHENLMGKIVAVDEDSARVVLKLAINGQNVGVSQYQLELMGEMEHRQQHHQDWESKSDHGTKGKRYGLIKKGDSRSPSPYIAGHQSPSTTNKESRSPSNSGTTHRTAHTLDVSPHRGQKKREQDLRDGQSPKRARLDMEHHGAEHDGFKDKKASKSRSRTSGYDESQDYESKQLKPRSKGGSSSHHHSDRTGRSRDVAASEIADREKCWLFSDLRVRMVDRRYKKGAFYNTKAVILDVVSRDTCICQTGEGKLLEGVKQHMLETVVPKTSQAVVMVVGGKRKGQIATVLERDRSKEKVVLELLQSKEIISLHYDNVCEYIGEVEDI